MSTRLSLLTVAAFAACASCASSRGSAPGAAPAAPASARPLSLVGPRCSEGRCACRPVDDRGRTVIATPDQGEGTVAAGHKRFELRTGRGEEEVEIAIDDQGTWRKLSDGVEAGCAYVDLAPGKHRLRARLRAHDAERGMAPRLMVREYGAATQDWYDAFDFVCGNPEACGKADVEAWARRVASLPRGLFDPCGSVRVSGVRYEVAHSAEHRVVELALEWVLDVYKFAPRFAHGAPRCKGPSSELAGGDAG